MILFIGADLKWFIELDFRLAFVSDNYDSLD